MGVVTEESSTGATLVLCLYDCHKGLLHLVAPGWTELAVWPHHKPFLWLIQPAHAGTEMGDQVWSGAKKEVPGEVEDKAQTEWCESGDLHG